VAFVAAASSNQVAVFDTLQYRLAGDAENPCGVLHDDRAGGCVVDEQAAELVGEPDAPWCARGGLFAGDEPVTEPAVQCGRCDTEFGGGLGDGEHARAAGTQRLEIG